MNQRASHQRAYVLHARPYRETSLLVDCFTLEAGRVSLLAKGVKRRKGTQRQLLQPFIPLLLTYTGRGDLKTFIDVEDTGSRLNLTGNRLACGLYLNELLFYLAPGGESAGSLFAYYHQALSDLTGDTVLGPQLRRFELRLLEVMGVVPDWGVECGTGERLLESGFYSICSEGPVSSDRARQGAALIKGEVFLALEKGELDAPHVAPHCKRVLRYFIDQQLEGRQLKSRELLLPVTGASGGAV